MSGFGAKLEVCGVRSKRPEWPLASGRCYDLAYASQGLVHPTALFADLRPHFLDRLAEAECTIGDRLDGAVA